ncbi:MAG: hypothetical protein NC225_04015 [Clostridium sp.]|nr:hypothetical protein [Clostridium sp.]MCM1398632.1 hypothetical protein [Clostridium sp.]MCM1459918.1 hypothetical protein [Bacteroides sp.]
MITVNILVLVFYIFLVIVSRHHFSKYKGGGRRSEFVRKHFAGPFPITKKRMIACMILFLVFNLISLTAAIVERKEEDGSNIIVRDDYGGQVKEYEINMDYQGDKTKLNYEVMPLEYTASEFYEKSEELFMEYERELIGSNTDLMHVCNDITIPEEHLKDFELTWMMSEPDIVASSGQVNRDKLNEKRYVTLTAVLEYGDYTNRHEYTLGIEPIGESEMLTRAKDVLGNLEKENRNQSEIQIPNDIFGVKLSLQQETNNTSVQIFTFGIIFCIIFALGEAVNERKRVSDRNRMLMDLYPELVNSLWLFLSAGLTVKSGMCQLIKMNNKKNVLVLEMEHAINQIDSGLDECTAYEELGQRLGPTAYRRLMNQISRNIKIGTKDLLKLMENEVAVSLEIRKENIRKKGEEASTKLLIPMVVMLLVVMLIIVTPVLVSL